MSVSGLDTWLTQATRGLSKDSAGLVRAEIQAHFESARAAVLDGGGTPEQAGRTALDALGEPLAANRQYRRVLLTSSEARILRESNWEASLVCGHTWLKGFFLAIPIAALGTAAALFFIGALPAARALLAGAIALGTIFAAPFLPVYTPSRSRTYRAVKWAALLVALVLAFGPDALRLSWLLLCCLWILVKTETTRESIRRKLPIARWPKQLYL